MNNFMRTLYGDEAAISEIRRLLSNKRKSKLASEIRQIIARWDKRESERLLKQAMILFNSEKIDGECKKLEVTAWQLKI